MMTTNGENMTEIEKSNKFVESQKEYGENIAELYYVGRVLKKNGFEIYDIDQAQKNFRQIMKLDKIDELDGYYQENKNGDIKEHFVSITKENFYNAFYEPIWFRLQENEKIKALEWLFEYIKNKHNLDVKITYLPKEQLFASSGTMGISYDEMRNGKRVGKIYVNLNQIPYYISPNDLIVTIVHELEHAKQKRFIKNYDNHKKDFYTISQLSKYYSDKFNLDDIPLDVNDKKILERALYRICEAEKSAELQGIKVLQKIIKQNEKDFGYNENITLNFKRLMRELLIGDNPMDIKQTDGLFTNEYVVLKGQGDNILKLMMLKTHYEEIKKIAEKAINYATYQKDKLFQKKLSEQITLKEYMNSKEEFDISLKENTKIFENAKDKIEEIKNAVAETYKNGVLPEEFDISKECEVLNITDEKSSKFPKWLNEEKQNFLDEIEIMKIINGENKEDNNEMIN